MVQDYDWPCLLGLTSDTRGESSQQRLRKHTRGWLLPICLVITYHKGQSMTDNKTVTYCGQIRWRAQSLFTSKSHQGQKVGKDSKVLLENEDSLQQNKSSGKRQHWHQFILCPHTLDLVGDMTESKGAGADHCLNYSSGDGAEAWILLDTNSTGQTQVIERRMGSQCNIYPNRTKPAFHPLSGHSTKSIIVFDKTH